MKILANKNRVDIKDVQVPGYGPRIDFVYDNRVLVWQRMLELTLPQFSKTFNLAQWIKANNPRNVEQVIVSNNRTQPSILSGNLSGLNVTLINNGEFRGTSPSSTAMAISSEMKLINNGWIRGAGGNGGKGEYGKNGGNKWISAKWKEYWDGKNWWMMPGPPNNVHCGAFLAPRTAWVVSSQTGGIPQMNWKGRYKRGMCSVSGPCSVSGVGTAKRGSYKRNFGGECGHRFNAYAVSVKQKDGYTILGGKAGTPGAGGIGESYSTKRKNGFPGGKGEASNPSGGHSGTNGTSGGNGGTWGKAGGKDGKAAGHAITGSAYLISGSKLGSRNGSTI